MTKVAIAYARGKMNMPAIIDRNEVRSGLSADPVCSGTYATHTRIPDGPKDSLCASYQI